MDRSVSRFWQAALIALMAISSATGAPPEEEAEARRVFESLYGQRVKAAQATREPADDVALAGQLLEAARQAIDAPRLAAILCEHAYNLGSADPAGYDHAAAAMLLLAQRDPAKASVAYDGIVDLRRKQYARAKTDDKPAVGAALVTALMDLANVRAELGDYQSAAASLRQALTVARQSKSADPDEILAHLELVQYRAKVRSRILLLQSKVLENASDKAAATELVTLYITEMDDPRGAALFVDRTADDKLKQRVHLATAKAEALTEAQALDLADWYRDFSAKSSAQTKGALLQRTAAYYEQFLSLHGTQDVQRVGAEVAMKEALEAMKALGVRYKPIVTAQKPANNTPAPAGEESFAGITGWETAKPLPMNEWLDITGILSLKYAEKGTWVLNEGKYILGAGAEEGSIFIPLAIRGDYELKVDVMTTEHPGQLAYDLPTTKGFIRYAGLFERGGEGGFTRGLTETFTVRMHEKFVRVGHFRNDKEDPGFDTSLDRLVPKIKDIPDAPLIVIRGIKVGLTISKVRIRILNGEAHLWKEKR
ncbi:MAG: hypothetical protein WD768_06745 [Phycisphaeraceae bacterium]